MREWAKAQGLNVSMRGRVASEIVDAFLDANPDAREAAGKLDLVRAAAAGAFPEMISGRRKGAARFACGLSAAAGHRVAEAY